MVTLPDGSTVHYEYAVTRPDGHAIGPVPKTYAEQLAAEIGGHVIRRQITRSPWRTA